MKIGIQIEHFNPAAGGAETYTEQLVKGLLSRDHEVHLFARTCKSLPAGAHFHAVPACGWLRWQKDRSYARRADTMADGAGLDVVLGMGKTFAMDVLQPHGGTIRRSQQQNSVRLRSAVFRALKRWSNHINPRQIVARQREARQYGRRPSPHLVAVSRMVANDMQRFHAVPDDRIHVIYNGVDLQRFDLHRLAAQRNAARQRFGLAPGTLGFALVAHNFKLKGVNELIEAAARLHTDGLDFAVLIAGKANPRRYRQKARRLGCGERIRFLGSLDAVEDLYAAADVYVHPTWYDPCSLVVLEALASGLPIITTAFNGASELITEGREGFVLTTPADINGLAERMRACCTAPARARMGQQARLLAQDFPWDGNVEAMLEVLATAAAEKRSRRSSTRLRTETRGL